MTHPPRLTTCANMQGKSTLGSKIAEVDYSHLSAREALEQLPGGLQIARGGVRITAHFFDGKVVGRAEVHVFRLPGSAVHTIPSNERGDLAGDLLEHIARELNLDDGNTKLIVEYTEQDGQLRVHWIDFAWEVAP
jgi:hypothetical protein